MGVIEIREKKLDVPRNMASSWGTKNLARMGFNFRRGSKQKCAMREQITKKEGA